MGISFNPFDGYAENPYPVFDNIAVVTPSDTDELPVVATKIYVGDIPSSESGERQIATVKVTTAGGQDFAFQTWGGLLFLPLRIRKVWSTGTTATNILALW